MEMNQIIEANRARQNRARQLNARAGAQVFPVLTIEAMAAFIMNALGGISCLKDIKNMGALLLPKLDTQAVTKVETENPSTISVCGQDFTVIYRENEVPKIFVASAVAPDGLWRNLPDAGVILPSGRVVAVGVGTQYGRCFLNTDIPALKANITSYLNEVTWNTWLTAGVFPSITLPNLADEHSAIAPVTETVYGACAVTSTPLIAFGTVAAKDFSYYGVPAFEARWFRVRGEAETANTVAVQQLAKFRTAAATKAEFDAAKVIASHELVRLNKAHFAYQGAVGWNGNLTQRFFDLGDAYSMLRDTQSVNAWTVRSQGLIAESESAIAQHTREQAEKRSALTPLITRVGSAGSAEFIVAFVDELLKENSPAKVHEILLKQATAAYGREQRQHALRAYCQGTTGKKFMAFNTAVAVSGVLNGALFWLEHRYAVPAVAEPQEGPAKSFVPAPHNKAPVQKPAPQPKPSASATGFGTPLAGLFDGIKLD